MFHGKRVRIAVGMLAVLLAIGVTAVVGITIAQAESVNGVTVSKVGTGLIDRNSLIISNGQDETADKAGMRFVSKQRAAAVNPWQQRIKTWTYRDLENNYPGSVTEAYLEDNYRTWNHYAFHNMYGAEDVNSAPSSHYGTNWSTKYGLGPDLSAEPPAKVSADFNSDESRALVSRWKGYTDDGTVYSASPLFDYCLHGAERCPNDSNPLSVGKLLRRGHGWMQADYFCGTGITVAMPSNYGNFDITFWWSKVGTYNGEPVGIGMRVVGETVSGAGVVRSASDSSKWSYIQFCDLFYAGGYMGGVKNVRMEVWLLDSSGNTLANEDVESISMYYGSQNVNGDQCAESIILDTATVGKVLYSKDTNMTLRTVDTYNVESVPVHGNFRDFLHPSSLEDDSVDANGKKSFEANGTYFTTKEGVGNGFAVEIGLNSNRSVLSGNGGDVTGWFTLSSTTPGSARPDVVKEVDKELAKPGEKVTYTVRVNIPSSAEMTTAYSSFVFTDTLDSMLTYDAGSFKLVDTEGNNVTSNTSVGSLNVSGNTLTYTFNKTWLSYIDDGSRGLAYNGEDLVFTFSGTVKADMWGKTIPNKATAKVNNEAVMSNEVVTKTPPMAKLAPVAKKVLTGRALQSGEFSFRLKSGSNVLQTKTNAANGDIVFDALEWGTAGTYTYQVEEVTPDSTAKVDAPPVPFTWTVTVRESNGQLVATGAWSPSNVFENFDITYPEPEKPTKSPKTQRTTPNGSVQFVVTEKFPVVDAHTGAKSIVFTDTLSDCLDVSRASVVASRGEWDRTVSGQTIKLTARNNDANLQIIQGEVTFAIDVPLKQGYDLSALRKNESGLRYDTNKAGIQIVSRDGTVWNLETNEVVFEVESYKLHVVKYSDGSYTGLVPGNANYGVGGTVFDVRDASGTLIGTLTTDASGKAGPLTLERAGTYTVTEVSAPAGHALTGSPKTVTLPMSSDTVTLDFTNPPLVCMPVIEKQDTETGKDSQGNAPSFAGFKVRVEYFEGTTVDGTPKASAVWVGDANGRIDIGAKQPESGTWPYKRGNACVVPLGTIRVTEVAAPAGYKVNPEPLIGHVVAGGNDDVVLTWE